VYQLLVWILFQSCPFCCHEYGRNIGPHWQSFLRQCKATYSGLSPGFPEAPLATHYSCAIHPFSTD
jgi:hypothetical protein